MSARFIHPGYAPNLRHQDLLLNFGAFNPMKAAVVRAPRKRHQVELKKAN